MNILETGGQIERRSVCGAALVHIGIDIDFAVMTRRGQAAQSRRRLRENARQRYDVQYDTRLEHANPRRAHEGVSRLSIVNSRPLERYDADGLHAFAWQLEPAGALIVGCRG